MQILPYDANPLGDSPQSKYKPNSPQPQLNFNNPQFESNLYAANSLVDYAEQLSDDAESDSAEEKRSGAKKKVKVVDRGPSNADQPFGFYAGPNQPGAEYQPIGNLQQPIGYQPGGPFLSPPGYQPAGYRPVGYQQPAGYQQPGFQPPPGYPHAGFQPVGYQAAGFYPGGYQPSGNFNQQTGFRLQPSGYEQGGYQPNGFQLAGNQPGNFQGYRPAGFNPTGYQPADYPRTGYQQPSYEQVMLGYPPAFGAQPLPGKLPYLANDQPFLNQLEPVLDSQLQGNRYIYSIIHR